MNKLDLSKFQNNALLEAPKILEVRDLTVSFKSDAGVVHAIRGVSFDLHKGETLCIVGESGCGKSTVCKTIMGILSNEAMIEKGSAIFEGEDLTKISEDEFHRIRGNKIGMIFQDPLSSLDPIMRIGKQITEATLINNNILKKRYYDLISPELTAFRNAQTDYYQGKEKLKAEAEFFKADANKKLEHTVFAMRKEGKSSKEIDLYKKQQNALINQRYQEISKENKEKIKALKAHYEQIKPGLKKALNEKRAIAKKDNVVYAKKIKQEYLISLHNIDHQIREAKEEETKQRLIAEKNKIKEDYIKKTKITPAIAKKMAIEIMKEVGISDPEHRLRQYPFEFSGGMRQRIVIAIALTANPDVLICDEPTTALDVTIQAQILELINKLKRERNMSIIFITHDLGVVANMADRIAVMYAGKIVEVGTSLEVFYQPTHPYTWALLSSIPDMNSSEKLEAIPGTPPNLVNPPKGDAFADRNKYALAIDFQEEPPLFKLSPTHYCSSWLLYKDAPKINPPKIVTTRIRKSLEKEYLYQEQQKGISHKVVKNVNEDTSEDETDLPGVNRVAKANESDLDEHLNNAAPTSSFAIPEHNRKVKTKPELAKNNVLLSVNHLKVFFPMGHWPNKFYLKAVHDTNFQIHKGETFGLVGESGCGKSTTGRSILRLNPITSGSIYYKGVRISAGDRWNRKEIKWSKIKGEKAIKEIEKGTYKGEFGPLDNSARDLRLGFVPTLDNRYRLSASGFIANKVFVGSYSLLEAKRQLREIAKTLLFGSFADVSKYGFLNLQEARRNGEHLVRRINQIQKITDLVFEQVTDGKHLTQESQEDLKKAKIQEIRSNYENIKKIQEAKIKQIRYDNQHVDKRLMSEIQMIFQDPIDSLDPRMTVEDIIQEGLMITGHRNRAQNHKKVIEALEEVGLIPDYCSRYPHEFSGGQRQRIGIARALIMNPKLLICDEPISALDVSIRAQIINLLNELKKTHDLSMLFIAHDLSVVKYFCDTIGVMYFGNMVELAPSDELFKHPLHPYTLSLLSAIPSPDPLNEKRRQRIKYDAKKEHDYSKDKPRFQEILPGHWVLANKAEMEKYRKMIAQDDALNSNRKKEELEEESVPAEAIQLPKQTPVLAHVVPEKNALIGDATKPKLKGEEK